MITRYKEMQQLFSPDEIFHRRKLWVALAEVEQELGPITDEQLDELALTSTTSTMRSLLVKKAHSP